jgi:hypothetical protein
MTTITVQYDIPEQLIRDIIITACEGGIGYWSQLESYDGPAIADGVEGSLPLRIREIEEEGWDESTTVYGPWRDLGIPEVVKGLRLMIQEWPDRPDTRRMIQAIANYESGNWDFDAGDADNVIQFSLLGDLVYG